MTDYPGLGTPAPHPYLVGQSEARAVLDSVRAAHRLDLGLPLDDRYVIWGHSQGGHAALFAGQLAPSYLGEMALQGVAALAPATTLADTFVAIEGTEPGNILTIFAVHAWSRYYADISEDVLTPAARGPAERIANVCLNQPSRLRIVVAGLRLPATVTNLDVATDPAWSARLGENTPTPDGVRAPLLVAQGLADELIVPAVTDAWVERRCDAGRQVEYRTYPEVSHLGIVGPGGSDALSWTRDRFAGRPAASSCGEDSAQTAETRTSLAPMSFWPRPQSNQRLGTAHSQEETP
jgi:acetyl esterase/lipase